MKPGLAGLACLLLLAPAAAAHRLDEYLQASLITLARDRVQIQLDLTPGVAVFPVVLAAIDTDRDGTISEAEQSAYIAQVLRDLSVSINGEPVRLRLVSSRFPEIGEMQEGRGVIRLEMAADLPAAWNPNHRLSFENHHQSPIAVYLVNSLVPEDAALRITGQSRNFRQSVYRVDYIQSGAEPGWIGAAALLLLAGLAIVCLRRSRGLPPQSRIASGTTAIDPISFPTGCDRFC